MPPRSRTTWSAPVRSSWCDGARALQPEPARRSGRPGAWVVAALVDAIALGLVVLRVCVHRAIPERAVWFHGPWTWSGFWDEVGEAAILGPVYVLLSVVAVIAVAVQGWRAGLRALRGTTPGA